MAATFGDPSGVYVLAFPSRGFDFSSRICGAHGYGTDSSGNTAVYIFLPYQADGSPCGVTLDTISIVASHELAEAITDPIPYTGWVGPGYLEIGDECQNSIGYVMLSNQRFAVQALWSNATNSSDPNVACVFSSPHYGV